MGRQEKTPADEAGVNGEGKGLRSTYLLVFAFDLPTEWATKRLLHCFDASLNVLDFPFGFAIRLRHPLQVTQLPTVAA